jgi:hypothetical protein
LDGSDALILEGLNHGFDFDGFDTAHCVWNPMVIPRWALRWSGLNGAGRLFVVN